MTHLHRTAQEHRSTAQLDPQFVNGVRDAARRGEPLAEEVRRILESSLGYDLTCVRVHTDPSADRLTRAVDAEAFTSGVHIFFRSGYYDPHSTDGIYLLAHEAAHVVQQTYGASGARGSAEGVLAGSRDAPMEMEADLAAAAVLMGFPCGDHLLKGAAAASPVEEEHLVVQRHASWEHRLLGDAPSTELDDIAKRRPNWQQNAQAERDLLWMWHQNPESVTEQQIQKTAPWVRTIRLGKSRLLVTYGELNTLPDYMANPTVLDNQPKEVLLPILQAVRQEGYNRVNGLLGHSTTASFQGAVSGLWSWNLLNQILETVKLDKLTWNIGPNHSNHYQALLGRNACHFAPFSWWRWEPFYTIARDLAQQAHSASDSSQKAQLTYQAWMNHGYADHFLQDSFAAGHLVNKTLVMQWFLEFAVSGRTGKWWAESFMADWDKIQHMTTAHQPGIAARALYTSDPGSARDPQTAEEGQSPWDRVRISGVQAKGPSNRWTAYQDYLAFLDNTVVNSAAGALHDHYNARSLWVSSSADTTPYQLWGDDTMLNGGDGVRIASDTAKMSQRSILELLDTGQTSITTQQVRDRFPTRVKSGSKTMALEQWNDSLKGFCLSDIFPAVHYYLLRTKPRFRYISVDQGQPQPPSQQTPPSVGTEREAGHTSTEL